MSEEQLTTLQQVELDNPKLVQDKYNQLLIEEMKNCWNCKKFGNNCMYKEVNYCCEDWSKK